MNEDINVESLWLIPKRDSSGKHENVYHGNFVPQIPNNLIKRYTSPGDLVLDLFMGSGTTLFECENLGRDFIGYDINETILDYVKGKMDETSSPVRFSINRCDVTDGELFCSITAEELGKLGHEKADFIIAHPPYMDIVRFTDSEKDLSHIADTDIFVSKFISALENAYGYLAVDKYFAIVIGDVYKKSEVVPLAFRVMDAVKRHFDVKMKGIIVKNIEGNRGKLGVNSIWHARARRSDYYIFKHEYIFVFKKIK